MNIPGTYRTTSALETQLLGEKVARESKQSKAANQELGSVVICLYGELGSGKTTFTQGFAKGLGYHRRLLSPTFLIMRTYDLDNNVRFHHLDLYRVHTDHDLDSLGLPEIFSDPSSIIVIEWAEKIAHMVPKPRWEIQFTAESDEIRKIEVYQRL